MAPAPIPLNDVEKAVFEFISNNDLSGLKSHMEIHKLKPDILDDHGMTPLTHACFKGNKEMAQYLLDQGADVNSNKHENGYTALHFAALSGKADLCQLLLSAGAKTYHQNSVGRTPAQMGAFVGNHQCVAVINNYIPKSEVDYYTVSHGLNQGPFLSPTLASILHKIIMQVNLHPVKIALSVEKSVTEELPNVKFVLEMMSQKEMRKGSESNQALSFKLHYLSYILSEIMQCNKPDQQGSCTEIFIKKILKNVSGEKYLETMMRECIREFPFRESAIFHQMITGLTAFKDPPCALSIVTTAINGQRGFLNDIKVCTTCNEETATKKCSKCKQVQYCDRECQRLHWFTHKKECNRNAEEITNKVETIKIH